MFVVEEVEITSCRQVLWVIRQSWVVVVQCVQMVMAPSIAFNQTSESPQGFFHFK